jgi:adenine phosphoribosyltransferase
MNMEIKEILNKTIRDVPDFPSKGVIFRDITPLFLDINLYNKVIDYMAEQYKNKKITKIIGLESRGFIFAISLAQKLNVPFVPIRKKGKLPCKTVSTNYDLEYGSETVEIHVDAVNEKDNVLIVDELLATGGTVCAAIELIKKLKGNVLGCAFVIELLFLNGKSKLKDVPYISIVQY